MTPLAAQLTKQLLIPVRDRAPFWKENIELLREALYETHFFEITQVLPLILDIGNVFKSRSLKDEVVATKEILSLLFLPAPKTWLELKLDNGMRMAYLCMEGHKEHISPPSPHIVAFYVSKNKMHMLGSILTDDFLVITADNLADVNPAVAPRAPVDPKLLGTAIAALILINSPRIIGRKQHMPNRGLERWLLRSQKLVGKFPLHAWTEIKLQVAKPPEIDDGAPHEAHLTGQRALHFCRKHIRIRFGQLEYVNAHWRGNPALGIKQSRYKVEP